MFAVATALACLVSRTVTPDGALIGLLWLPTAVMLVGILTRGYSVLLPGVVGLTAMLSLLGVSSSFMLGSVLAVLVAPVVCHQVIERMRRFRRAQSHLVQTSQMFLAIALVQAPISAAFICAASPLEGFIPMLGPLSFASIWVIEAVSGIVFVRGIMTWMPNDGSGFCPASGMQEGLKVFSPGALTPYAAILAFFGMALLAHEAGHDGIARVLAIPVFATAALSALSQSRRMASTVLMAAFIAIAAVRVRTDPFMPAVERFNDLAELSLLMLTGAALLHMLNSLIEERLQQQKRLRRKAFSSELSGLPNLRALTARLLSQKVRRLSAAQGLQLAEVAIAGLDKWADLAGRQATMQAESEIGRRLQTIFDSRLLMLAHIGSGRFVLLFERSTSDETLIETLQSGFDRRRFTIANQVLPLRYSIGVVDAPAGSHEPEALLASLSLAQQQAVTLSSRFYRLTLNNDRVREYRRELAWVENVRGLLERDRLRLFAQPIAPADMDPDSGLHFEILARMADENGELIAPNGFLGAISKAGMQIELDRQVISRTIRYLDDDLELLDATELCAINVTGPTICDPGFCDFLFGLMDRSRVAPKQIAIEITESDTIADLEAALENVRAIAAAGIRVAVDDFGTGQATFEYIRRLGPDILKIDGSFVRRYQEDALDREIVESVVRMAHAIGASTVAEFVESEALGEQMRAIGVDYLQGYAIAKPMPVAQLKSFCTAKREALREQRTARCASAGVRADLLASDST